MLMYFGAAMEQTQAIWFVSFSSDCFMERAIDVVVNGWSSMRRYFVRVCVCVCAFVLIDR